jgi:putative addiction module CopG family antidote
MEISLSAESQRFVNEKIKSGQFASPDDVVNSALSALRLQEELTEQDLEELRREIEIGLQQSREGRSTPLDMAAIKADVRRRRLTEQKTP